MSKENLRNRGITLIALIITIIVMLILTGVTLSITLGDNGLVNKAKEATTQTQVAMDRELLLSAVVGAIGNDGKVNLSAIVLPEGFTGSNGTYTSKNGNAFTVSENGEILYTGEMGSGNGTEIENVDLNGKYYWDYDVMSSYYEIRNHNTLAIIDEGEEYDSIPIVIDYENQSFTVTYEYEDGSTHEIIVDEILYKYEFVIKDGEIVNIILIENEECIYFQNENGFEYNLEGTYFNEEENATVVFYPETGIAIKGYTGDGAWNGETKYFCVNGYCFAGFEIIKTSSDLNTITIRELEYKKQVIN